MQVASKQAVRSKGWRRLSAAVLMVCCGQAASIARADLPPAMDRVPTDAMGAVAIRNLTAFHERVSQYAELFNVDLEAGGFSHMEQLLQTPGLAKDGSAVVVILPHPPEEENQDKYTVVLTPVSDAKAFATSLKAEGEGVMKADLDGTTVYMKDAGGGYVVMGPDETVVSGFKPAQGSSAKLKQAMGASAVKAADHADVVVYLTMPLVKPGIEAGQQQMKEQGEMVAMMAGGQGDQMAMVSKAAEAMAQSLERDGQAVVAAIGADEFGVTFDLIAQFKEGSSSANQFQVDGSANSIIAALPQVNYLFAGALDTSSPIIKSWMKEAQQQQAQAGGEAIGAWTQIMASMDNVDGVGSMIGLPPGGMMGGMLTASSMFIKTKDPQGFVTGMKAGIEGVNGQQVGQAKAKTSYKAGAVDVAGGKKVDSWEMDIPLDPDDPNAMMMQQAQMMLYGTTGPAGLIGTTDTGVVMTMGKNSLLMGSALESAKTGKGFAGQEVVTPVESKLPGNRVFELYVGVKGIIDMVGPFVAMQTGGAPPKAPDRLAPVALAGSMSGGAVGMHFVVPREVLQTVADLLGQFQADVEDGADEPDADAPAEDKKRSPRF